MKLIVRIYSLLLVALLYPVSFLAHNALYFSIDAIFVGMGASLLATLVLYGICFIITRQHDRAFILVTLLSLLGWVFSLLFKKTSLLLAQVRGVKELEPDAQAIWLWVFTVLGVGAVTWFYRKTSVFLVGDQGRFIFYSFLHVLLLLPLINFTYLKAVLYWAPTLEKEFTLPVFGAQKVPGDLPDIYYIVLDGYGRQDILKSLYHYDNKGFIDFLKQRGFYIASDARSNYAQTLLSIPSALNMNYLDQHMDLSAWRQSHNRAPLVYMIQQSRVRYLLEQLGYKFVVIQSGYGMTEINDADIMLRPPEPFINQRNLVFLYAMAADSPLPVLISFFNRKKNQREDLYAGVHTLIGNPANRYAEQMYFRFKTLKEVDKLSGPKFVFAHLISPHPPFVFDAEDDIHDYRADLAGQVFVLGDGSHYTKNKRELIEDYVSKYPRQLSYVNRQISDFIDNVLVRRSNSVILIQGDHGPGAHLDWEDITRTNLEERFSILSAYYFPDQDYRRLSPSITPVNSFRIVLNHYFSMDFPLLENRHYFSSSDRPYDFTDISEKLH